MVGRSIAIPWRADHPSAFKVAGLRAETLRNQETAGAVRETVVAVGRSAERWGHLCQQHILEVGSPHLPTAWSGPRPPSSTQVIRAASAHARLRPDPCAFWLAPPWKRSPLKSATCKRTDVLECGGKLCKGQKELGGCQHKRKHPFAANGSADWRACGASYTVGRRENGPSGMRRDISHSSVEANDAAGMFRHPSTSCCANDRSDPGDWWRPIRPTCQRNLNVLWRRGVQSAGAASPCRSRMAASRPNASLAAANSAWNTEGGDFRANLNGMLKSRPSSNTAQARRPALQARP